MREINIKIIKEHIKSMCMHINYNLSDDAYKALKEAAEKEESPLGKEIIETIIENDDYAKSESVPMCQDTGLTIVFVEVGQDVHIVGGNLIDAINQGVAEGYIEGYLRKSVVDDPVFDRINTKNNAPAIIYTDIVPGDKVKISVAAKGAGSENMGALKMLKPSDGVEGIIDFIVSTVYEAGSNPCPPIIIGVGIGGTMDKAVYLAKKSLMRNLYERNSNEKYAKLEEEILKRVNELGVGPQGLGGTVTALAVNIEYFPTHIAQMPVAININCHASRHTEIEI